MRIITTWAQWLFLFFFLCSVESVLGADDVIDIKTITAGDTYPDASVAPRNLISMDGINPNPPTDLSTATYGIVGWNCWHTSGNDNSKAWLLLDIGMTLPVSEMYIWNMNQYSNSDRDIKDITLTYSFDSTDGKDGEWYALGDYVIPQGPGNGNPCTAQLSIDIGKTVRFIKIQAKSSYGSPYWGLGKIMLVQDHSATGDQDIVDLKLLYKKVNGLHFYEYTNASWKNLEQEKDVAKSLIDTTSNDADAIRMVTDKLQKALDALVKKENVALGATAFVSSFYSEGYESRNLVDGNFSTRWASVGVDASTALYLTIDLGSVKSFNQISVFETPDYCGRIDNLRISVSQDNVTWNKWCDKSAKYAYISAVGNVVSARYIKVDFLNCSPEGINVDEIMVFNDLSAEGTGEPIPWRDGDASWIRQEPGTTPDVYQIRKANLKYGMFIHYGINTFLGEEWTDGSHPASDYHPDLSTLDPESWVKAAYEGGMNFVVLVAKHHEGFATWNTSVGTYNINHTGREGDKRDIVKEVSDACRKYGIKFGLYYSAWDRNWDLNNTQESTGLDRVELCQKYNDFALAQITELMDGRYGEISEFWIDGSWVKSNKAWEFGRMYNTVKTLQPTCQMAINCTIKGINPDQMKGGEELFYFPSDFRLQDPMFTRPGADADPKIYKHDGQEYYLPFEATICINNTWFWTKNNNAASVISLAKMKTSYDHMVEQKNTLVVNLAPGTNGLFNDFDVKGLYEGARALGIARGEARTDKESGECAVRVDFVTDKGYVASPTQYVYGKEGESFIIQAKDLAADGYRFMGDKVVLNGKFTKSEIHVQFVYEDKGTVATGLGAQVLSSNVQRQGDDLIVSSDVPCEINIYTVDGMDSIKKKLESGVHRIDVKSLHGLYVIDVRSSGSSASSKILIP